MTLIDTNSVKQLIQVESNKLSNTASQVIGVGDIVRVLVKNRDAESGQGQLVIKGNLIAALIPDSLQAGDSFFAKVVAENNKLIFQLIENQQNSQLLPQEVLNVNNMLEELLKDALLKGISFLDPYLIENNPETKSEEKNLPSLKLNFKNVEEIYQSLFKELGLNEEVANSSDLFKLLQNSSSGETTKILKKFLAEINKAIGSPDEQKQSVLLKDLTKVFEKFITLENKTPYQVRDFLNQSWDILNKLQVFQLKAGDKDFVDKIKVNLKAIKDSSETSMNLVKELNKQVSDQLKNSFIAQLSLTERSVVELQNLQQHIEQMVNTQELVNNLNPLMQLIGEPALILFPFIAQGLLNHSEIKIDPDLNRKKKNSGGEDEKSESNNELYRRIQVSVPLPNMGTVGVDIAYRNEEILIKFTLEDKEAADFLSEQTQNLIGILRANNFQKTEISTHLGAPEPAHEMPWLNNDKIISFKA